ncbi:unnamed protein product [Bursaphelenchus okinawaensis]|uniref:Uncharacterized protein n=1 Tax=Bursaphelenchus okinawaensis TaxID=465554 RepID=A0A811KA07_9BILA|nr:unnamed protein product [Bursaphelenchus okinawaensis]CAG9098192.1 unnamed protein product [Bursaphelenchus okinawaensis]
MTDTFRIILLLTTLFAIALAKDEVALAKKEVALARDKAHVYGTFYCSIKTPTTWIPSTTHLKFWDKGRIFDNTLKEFNLSDDNQYIDENFTNGIYGLNLYLTIYHTCTHDGTIIKSIQKLHKDENNLGKFDLYRAT